MVTKLTKKKNNKFYVGLNYDNFNISKITKFSFYP